MGSQPFEGVLTTQLGSSLRVWEPIPRGVTWW
jgi:hypothetical protein